MTFNIDRQPIKPERRGSVEFSGSVGDSVASSTCPRIRTSGTRTTALKSGKEQPPPPPTAASGDSSPVLPFRCRKHQVSKKKSKKDKKTRKSKSKASSSTRESKKKKTAPQNGTNISTSSSSRPAHRLKKQKGLRCLVSSVLSPISEDTKKISINSANLCDALIVLGCEGGESEFKKSEKERNSLLRHVRAGLRWVRLDDLP